MRDLKLTQSEALVAVAPASPEPLPEVSLLRPLAIPAMVFPEGTAEHQITNTLGTLLLYLGDHIQSLESDPLYSPRSAELRGRIVGNHIRAHLDPSNLPRLDHHIYKVNETEIELRITERKVPCIDIIYKVGNFKFDCEASFNGRDGGGLSFAGDISGNKVPIVTDESPTFLHALNGVLSECGIRFYVKFHDERFPKTMTSLSKEYEGKYSVEIDTTPAEAFDPTTKEYPEIMRGLALGVSQAFRTLLPKEFH